MSRNTWVRCVLLGVFLSTQLIVMRGVVQAADCLSAGATAPGCAYGLPADQYQALLPLILANRTPGVQPLAVDAATIKQYTRDGQRPSSMTGVLVGGAFPFPMAWVITAVRPSAVPGQDPDSSVPVLPHYSRVYIFATLKAHGWKWYLVGPGQWVQQTEVAILVPPTRPQAVQGRWVAVDLWQQVLTAYEGDRLVFTTLISSGKPSHPTRPGVYNVWLRLVTGEMNSSMGDPNPYSLPDVPFVMYFDQSISLHGAYWHDQFGIALSHGCVNMSLTDAHWLFDWTQATPNFQVYVWSSR